MILNHIEMLDNLKQSADYELLTLYRKNPATIDEVVDAQDKKLQVKVANLQQQADKLLLT